MLDGDVLLLARIDGQVEELAGSIEPVALVTGAHFARPVVEQDAVRRRGVFAEEPWGEADAVERLVADSIDPDQFNESRVKVDRGGRFVSGKLDSAG